jgi:hypothetical protein
MSRTKDTFKLDFDNNSQKKIEYAKVKAHYIVHEMLSQGNFCKILGFLIGHV